MKKDGYTYGNKFGDAGRAARLQLAAVGMEAEFTLSVDGRQVRPEAYFGDPRAFVRGPLVHRTGTSYHVPSGSAVYFDTGVIELVTPVIELQPAAPAQAVRSLWEAIALLQSNAETRGIPVVAVTASEPDQEEIQEAGFCALITKPVSPPEMVQAVGICLEAYQQGDRWVPHLGRLIREAPE